MFSRWFFVVLLVVDIKLLEIMFFQLSISAFNSVQMLELSTERHRACLVAISIADLT